MVLVPRRMWRIWRAKAGELVRCLEVEFREQAVRGTCDECCKA